MKWKKDICIGDACCWKTYWRAISNTWSGRKMSAIGDAGAGSDICLHCHTCLFKTLKSKPWQMQMQMSPLPCKCIRRAMASDASCWKISWTALSNWWSGMKMSALAMKVHVKTPACTSYLCLRLWKANEDVASTLIMHKKDYRKWCILLVKFLNSNNKQLMKWKDNICIEDEGAG